jgi:hypothetical protein
LIRCFKLTLRLLELRYHTFWREWSSKDQTPISKDQHFWAHKTQMGDQGNFFDSYYSDPPPPPLDYRIFKKYVRHCSIW